MCFITCPYIYPSFYGSMNPSYIFYVFPFFKVFPQLSLPLPCTLFNTTHITWSHGHPGSNRGWEMEYLAFWPYIEGQREKGAWEWILLPWQTAFLNLVHISPSRFPSHHCISQILYSRNPKFLKGPWAPHIFLDSNSCTHSLPWQPSLCDRFSFLIMQLSCHSSVKYPQHTNTHMHPLASHCLFPTPILAFTLFYWINLWICLHQPVNPQRQGPGLVYLGIPRNRDNCRPTNCRVGSTNICWILNGKRLVTIVTIVFLPNMF